MLQLAAAKSLLPSRRREESLVTVSAQGKALAGQLAQAMREHLDLGAAAAGAEDAGACKGVDVKGRVESGGTRDGSLVAVRCLYLGKVVEDVLSLVTDARKRCGNTVLLRFCHAHGVFKALLASFRWVAGVLWETAQERERAGGREGAKGERSTGEDEERGPRTGSISGQNASRGGGGVVTALADLNAAPDASPMETEAGLGSQEGEGREGAGVGQMHRGGAAAGAAAGATQAEFLGSPAMLAALHSFLRLFDHLLNPSFLQATGPGGLLACMGMGWGLRV